MFYININITINNYVNIINHANILKLYYWENDKFLQKNINYHC